MPVLTRIARRHAARLRDERGFTMVTVVMAMLAVMLLSVAALSAAQGDLPAGKHDLDRKVAYAAAEAGVQNYLFHLVDDVNYWAKCTTVAAPVNDPWDGVSTRRWASVPGSRARYTVELLPANGSATCETSHPDDTMIDNATGTFRIRITGQALTLDGLGGVKRTIVVNFKRQSLLDYIYFTDKENLDPSLYAFRTGPTLETDDQPGATTRNVTQWGMANCNRYYGDNPTLGNRSAQVFDGATGAAETGIKVGADWLRYAPTCYEILFASGDVVRGQLHTNDEISCSSVTTFGRDPADRIEVASTGQTAASPNGYRNCTPYVNFGMSTALADAGSWKGKADGTGKLNLPLSNASLRRDTAPAYRFVGNVTVVMSGSKMTVTGTTESGTNYPGTAGVSLPADAVLYASNSPTVPCVPYNPIDTAAASPGCGNITISGNYSVNVTFGAANDIIITGNVTRSGGSEALLGLISNKFTRVTHPVTNQTYTPTISGGGTRVTNVVQACDNVIAGTNPIQIDAAILALTGSFIVDNFYCGNPVGTLTVNGSISQSYRGTVGQGNGTNGYIKNYYYDNRLKYRSPPKFLDPLEAGWVVKTYNEQVPAR